MHDHQIRRGNGPADGCEIPQRIPWHAVVHEWQQPQSAAMQQYGVTIRLRLGHVAGGNDPAPAIVDYDWLAQRAGNSLSDDARGDVARTARLRGHHAYGLGRKV